MDVVLGAEHRSTEQDQSESKHDADEGVEGKPAYSPGGDDRYGAEHSNHTKGHEDDCETRDHWAAATWSARSTATRRCSPVG